VCVVNVYVVRCNFFKKNNSVSVVDVARSNLAKWGERVQKTRTNVAHPKTGIVNSSLSLLFFKKNTF
jgi:hypothetical protein